MGKSPAAGTTNELGGRAVGHKSRSFDDGAGSAADMLPLDLPRLSNARKDALILGDALYPTGLSKVYSSLFACNDLILLLLFNYRNT
jgi:hypothetical protein